MNRERCCGWIVTAHLNEANSDDCKVNGDVDEDDEMSFKSEWRCRSVEHYRVMCYVYMCNHRNMNHLNSLFFAQIIWLASSPLPCNIECDWVKESCVEWWCLCDATIKFQSPAWFLCMCRPLGFLCSIMQSSTWKQGSTLPWPQWHLQLMT